MFKMPKLVYPTTLCALVVIFILTLLENKNQYIQAAAKWLGVLALPYAFNLVVYTGISVLNYAFPSCAMFFSIVGCVLLLVVNIPWVIVDMPIVKNGFLRVLSIAIIDVSFTMNANDFINLPESLHFLVYDALIVAIEIFVLGFFITKAWDLKFSWNLKFVKTGNFQLTSLIVLVLVMVWLIFFSTYANIANTWTELLAFWHWTSFEVSHYFTAGIVAFAATAGIYEETIRILEIIALLYAMRNFKGRIMLAVVISAILFSLEHLSNLGTITNGTFYSVDMTAQQLTYAFGIGLAFGVLYLYTGKLWLGMLIHFLYDLESVSTDSVTTMFTGWPVSIMLLIVGVVIFAWMLTGKRRKFMEDNADRIVGR
ncbi:immunity protein [Lactobacillus ultunensis DSM 16047]|nr:immunity protein [Lactobacillus ultunensis DSM 16047]